MDDNEELPPPPPAYTDTEFDQKVHEALLVSEKTRQPEAGEEQWEQWNEALFEAAASGKAANSYQHASSSSSPTAPVASGSSSRSLPPPPCLPEIAPLRIQRAKPPLPSSDVPSSDAAAGPPFPQQQQQQPYNNNPSDDEHDAAPPPPFSVVGPSLDGPPFEEVSTLSYDASQRAHSEAQQQQWQQPAPAAVPSLEPVVPLQLPSTTSRERHSMQPISEQQHQPPEHAQSRYSLPATASSANIPRFSSYNARPASNYSSTMANNRIPMNAPRLSFDHSMAYGSSADKGMSGHVQASPQTPVDPLSLYNSTVVPHMKPRSMQPRRGSNVSNQPARPPSAQSHYSQMTVSDRTSIMSHSNMTQPFAPIPQYPVRPLSSNSQFARYPQQPQNPGPAHAPISYDRWASSESQYHANY